MINFISNHFKLLWTSQLFHPFWFVYVIQKILAQLC